MPGYTHSQVGVVDYVLWSSVQEVPHGGTLLLVE